MNVLCCWIGIAPRAIVIDRSPLTFFLPPKPPDTCKSLFQVSTRFAVIVCRLRGSSPEIDLPLLHHERIARYGQVQDPLQRQCRMCFS